MVHAVSVGGRIVMKDRRSTTIDDADLLDRVDAYARSADSADIKDRRKLVEQLEIAVRGFYSSWTTEAGPRAYNLISIQ